MLHHNVDTLRRITKLCLNLLSIIHPEWLDEHLLNCKNYEEKKTLATKNFVILVTRKEKTTSFANFIITIILSLNIILN